MTRLIAYVIILAIFISIPFDFSKKTTKKVINVKSNSVKISLVNQPKPKPKQKIKPKPKPKPKQKIKPKPKPVPKQEPIKKIEPTPVKEIFQKEELIKQVEEEIVEPTIVDTVEIKQTYYSYVRSVIEENKIYPKKARRFKHQGDVKVSFFINSDGSTQALEIITASRYNTLNKAVKKMFKKLKFKTPPKELEKPIKIFITINFKLK